MDRQHHAGELLYLEGEVAEYVWFVKQGSVALFREQGADAGEGTVRAIRFAGSFIGLELLVSEVYTETARVVTDAVLCGATAEGIDNWLGPADTPARVALELSLRSRLADRTRGSRSDGTSVQRVASWLLDEGPRGQTLELPRQLVADLLGMRPETLSRAIAELRDAGAVDATRTTLRIADPAALVAAAGA